MVRGGGGGISGGGARDDGVHATPQLHAPLLSVLSWQCTARSHQDAPVRSQPHSGCAQAVVQTSPVCFWGSGGGFGEVGGGCEVETEGGGGNGALV